MEQLTSSVNTTFHIWFQRISTNTSLNQSDFIHLKNSILQYLTSIIPGLHAIETEELDENLTHRCRTFCTSDQKPSIYSGEDIYNSTLSEMTIRNVLTRGTYRTINEIISERMLILYEEFFAQLQIVRCKSFQILF